MVAPKLRFQEFDGDWSKTSFQDLFTFKNGINASKDQYGSGIKFINVLDIINNPNGITYESIIGSVDVTTKEIEKNLVRYGDVLFQRSSETREEVGQSNVYLSEEPVVFGGFVIRGTAQQEYNPLFINGLLRTHHLRDQITQLSGGSTRFNIGQDSLNKVTAYLPSINEQTKIASFLSAVDEKIAQLSQKLQLLNRYKQGTMQKLFNQQIRFKANDGSEFEEWETKTLGEIIKFVNGKGHENDVDSNGSYILINSKFLSTNGAIAKKVCRCNQKVMNDSLVMVMSDVPNGKALAKVMHISDGSKFALNQRIGMFIFDNKHRPKFFQYQLNRHQYYLSFDSGVGQTNLKKEDVLNCPIFVPCLEEQAKIANFLSTIDQKIDVASEQLEQAKLWKKGLLQQMFV